MNADPFAEMVKSFSGESRRVVPKPVGKRIGSIAQAGMQLLEKNGPMTSAQLMHALQLPDTRNVWGVFKLLRANGQVLREGQFWTLNPDYLPPYMVRAIEALRDLGWSVNPPDKK